MSWYKKGDDAYRAMEERDKLARMMQEKYVPRFFLRPDQQADIIFVDDDGFFCERHVVQMGGRWQDITCPAAVSPCPICISDNKKPLPVVFYTVIDLRPYEDRDGRKHSYRKVLLGARSQLARQIRDFKKQYGSLVGLRFTLKRYQQKEAACGTIFGDVHRKDGKIIRYNLLKLGKDFGTPFDYETILAPPTPEEFRAMGFSVQTIGDTPMDVIDEDLGALEGAETTDDIRVNETSDEAPFDVEGAVDEAEGGTIIEEAFGDKEDD